MGELIKDRIIYIDDWGTSELDGPEGESIEFPLPEDPMRRRRLIIQQAASRALKEDANLTGETKRSIKNKLSRREE
jgi:hypothetical protein